MHQPTPNDLEARLLAAQATIAQQQELIQGLLDAASQGVCIIDASGRLARSNRLVNEMLDLPASYTDAQPSLQELAKYMAERGDFGGRIAQTLPELHGYLSAAPGARLPVSYTRTTLKGRVVQLNTLPLASGAMIRTFTDTTRYEEAKQASARYQALLQVTQSLASVAGSEYDLKTGQVHWTPEVFHMLETTPEEYTPTAETMHRFFTPQARKLSSDSNSRALAKITDGQTAPQDLELEMITAKGRHIWVLARAMLTVENGRVVKRTTVAQDITARRQTEAALRASEENFRVITGQVPGMVFRLSLFADGRRQYSFVSEGARELFGVEPAAVMADVQLLTSMRHPDDIEAIHTDLEAAAQERGPMLVQYRFVMKDGAVKWVQIASSLLSQDSDCTVRVGVMTDITARKNADAQLQEAEARWKLALESTGDGLWDWHVQEGVEYYSNRYKEMYGYDAESRWQQADGYANLVHPDDRDRMVKDQLAHFNRETSTYANEHRVRCADGNWKWVLSRGMVLSRDEHDRPLRMIGTHSDISKRKENEALIWRQARYDPLTGLPNRRLLRERLELDMARCAQAGLRLTVLFVDLDHFKEVNDALGHDSGDALLVAAARRIQQCLGQDDTVARMGGDEFTVLLFNPANDAQVQDAAENILGVLSQAFTLGDNQVHVSASIGATTFPKDGAEVENLLKNADQALYAAKGEGRNRCSLFTPALKAASDLRAQLARDLRAGLGGNQFHMAYQPIVSLKDGRIHKAEALLRWQHPIRGLVAPADFVPVAETSGLIIPVGDWVFAQVAAQAKRWRASLDADFQVSVNKSPVQFLHDRGSHQTWLDQLRALGLPGSAIAVEITEGLLLEPNQNVNRQLLEMSNTGIQVSLDDFGTGYSSLSYLQKFDIDYIKIDRSFVSALQHDATALPLCKAIIFMAHELGIKVVAEGIETAKQRDLLAAAGCDYGQGFWFAHPMPAEDFEAFVALRLAA